MLKYIQALDLVTFHSVFNYSGRFSFSSRAQPRNLARLISHTADGWLYLALVPMAILFKRDEIASYLYLAVLGFSIERSLYFILKNSIKRPRPYRAIKDFKSVILASDEFSLPSGHTSAAFFFTTFISLAFSPLFLVLYLWATLVGLSRIILGVHFLTDVIAGALMGIGIALLLL